MPFFELGVRMKLAKARSATAGDRLREQWRQSRAAAQTLRAAFPQVESIRLDLRFSETGVRSLAPQSHVLHPPASAFFKFCCPHFDCDGRFNLTDAVQALLEQGGRRLEGSCDCPGERLKNSAGKQPCQLRLGYVISVDYHSPIGNGPKA